ncbi:hypothetical protein FRC12_004663 [Ceratobasidium sp. 428]|nr:hypothetical protein FRC12_004663 [Ceratobasidium sp. 428]
MSMFHLGARYCRKTVEDHLIFFRPDSTYLDRPPAQADPAATRHPELDELWCKLTDRLHKDLKTMLRQVPIDHFQVWFLELVTHRHFTEAERAFRVYRQYIQDGRRPPQNRLLALALEILSSGLIQDDPADPAPSVHTSAPCPELGEGSTAAQATGSADRAELGLDPSDAQVVSGDDNEGQRSRPPSIAFFRGSVN